MKICKKCRYIRKGSNKLHPVCSRNISEKLSPIDGLHRKMERCININKNGNCPMFKEKRRTQILRVFGIGKYND